MYKKFQYTDRQISEILKKKNMGVICPDGNIILLEKTQFDDVMDSPLRDEYQFIKNIYTKWKMDFDEKVENTGYDFEYDNEDDDGFEYDNAIANIEEHYQHELYPMLNNLIKDKLMFTNHAVVFYNVKNRQKLLNVLVDRSSKITMETYYNSIAKQLNLTTNVRYYQFYNNQNIDTRDYNQFLK